ncbi:CHAP domain-containing protein [Pseudoalteromonas sp. JBTF-M23]|uniref:CHAP domain-containing protein n=1 Tax=Pseudoalteromonas caenipelagi TaxID=2726988 RepID=A0A849VDN9_9GAMM|nr:CHAP domain-containing protein [Pseudoalteromonas caenipelagi]NOU50673.1 CHAP domain-containing protein [Pseudoalteromonas caenipelagi]
MNIRQSFIWASVGLFASHVQAVNYCGGQTSINNPFECCTSAKGVEGNCTWFAWKKAKDVWGHALQLNDYPRHAYRWDVNTYKAINKTSGYIYRSTPTLNSVAIQDSRNGSLGHVAWVTNIDGTQLTVQEQNCESDNQYPNGIERNSNFFNSYLLGIRVQDFWVKAHQISSDPNASIYNPNFDAQFKVKNITNSTPYYFRNLALAVHDSQGNYLYDMKKFEYSKRASDAIYTLSELSDGNYILSGGEASSGVRAVSYFTRPGQYRIVAKVRWLDNSWTEVGYQDITVQ